MKRVLIANRGEIAVRIAQACASYGVESVAVYADPDAGALHTLFADAAYRLPGSSPSDTYLNADALIDVARRSGADAVHPGYGFLSENSAFAQAVIDAGFTWIGPDPETIRRLGDKVEARRLAQSVGAPLVAGSDGPVDTAADAEAFSREHGLPVAIKAAFGGGGRGMKVAWRQDEVAAQFESAVREATAAFGRGECYVEQYLSKPRHVEAQVIADRHGHVVVVGTRDCSLQRRNQKLVEEAPAPFLSDKQRASIERAARDICAAAGYVSAGTVEFLVGEQGTISFLEVNTRLQVEHPVTEMTTGVDLVRQQLLVADGLPLEIVETPVPSGHAFEFRINAEDPGRGFLPVPGRIEAFDAPGAVRLDTGVRAGDVVGGSFDSMLAKLIVWGRDRDDALRRSRQVLRTMRVEGVPTVVEFDRRVLEDPAFTADRADRFAVHTQWIETECSWLNDLGQPLGDEAVEAPARQTWIEIDGRLHRLRVPANLLGAGPSRSIRSTASGESTAGAAPGAIIAPMAGTLSAWKAQDGQQVTEGQTIAVMEAMKMEVPVQAPRSGTLRIDVQAGADAVSAGTQIGRVEEG